MNSNATSLPKSFPIPIEGREDFFSIDPKSFNIKQLNDYRKEMFRLIGIEKKNRRRMVNYSNAHIQACMKKAIEEDFAIRIEFLDNQGRVLAEKAMKSNSRHSETFRPSTFNSNESIGCFDPKTLTLSQLQLYIRGITEETIYEKKLTDEFHNESSSRLQAYEKGIENANEELSRRKEK